MTKRTQNTSILTTRLSPMQWVDMNKIYASLDLPVDPEMLVYDEDRAIIYYENSKFFREGRASVEEETGYQIIQFKPAFNEDGFYVIRNIEGLCDVRLREDHPHIELDSKFNARIRRAFLDPRVKT